MAISEEGLWFGERENVLHGPIEVHSTNQKNSSGITTMVKALFSMLGHHHISLEEFQIDKKGVIEYTLNLKNGLDLRLPKNLKKIKLTRNELMKHVHKRSPLLRVFGSVISKRGLPFVLYPTLDGSYGVVYLRNLGNYVFEKKEETIGDILTKDEIEKIRIVWENQRSLKDVLLDEISKVGKP